MTKRYYYLAYRHPKVRVRKKNQHRFQREIRKQYKRGKKTLFEVIPEQLKVAMKNTKYTGDGTYMCDHQFPATKLPWWYGRQPEDPYPLFSIGEVRPIDYPYPYMNAYGNTMYHPPL